MFVQMAEFVLNNNYFESGGKMFHQISETTFGTKFAPPSACIFMDKLKADFLKTQKLQPFVWFKDMDDVFFI